MKYKSNSSYFFIIFYDFANQPQCLNIHSNLVSVLSPYLSEFLAHFHLLNVQGLTDSPDQFCLDSVVYPESQINVQFIYVVPMKER